VTLIKSFNVGTMRCHALEAGRQHLDGGAMFGVVPKLLWAERIQPDELNRIPLALRCLLVEHDAGPVLIDTGIGNKQSGKFLGIYGVENSGAVGPTQLEDALREAGVEPEEVRWVINTHLHFDHAGGNTSIERRGGSVAADPARSQHQGSGADGAKEIRLAFPNATYVVQRGELDFALKTNERTAASYLAPNFDPVTAAGRWQLVDGRAEVLPGIELIPTPGHVPHHQSVLITKAGETVCFVGDLVPTAAHIPLPWIMGYDLEPMVTLETKRALLARAEVEGWSMFFEHDPEVVSGRVERDSKSFACKVLDTVPGPA
jgi:glyoxylase-like metal-dependent hydrolase (beta-lactamase superfamily II)